MEAREKQLPDLSLMLVGENYAMARRSSANELLQQLVQEADSYAASHTRSAGAATGDMG